MLGSEYPWSETNEHIGIGILCWWLFGIYGINAIYLIFDNPIIVNLTIIERHQDNIFPLQAFASVIGAQLHPGRVADAIGRDNFHIRKEAVDSGRHIHIHTMFFIVASCADDRVKAWISHSRVSVQFCDFFEQTKLYYHTLNERSHRLLLKSRTNLEQSAYHWHIGEKTFGLCLEVVIVQNLRLNYLPSVIILLGKECHCSLWEGIGSTFHNVQQCFYQRILFRFDNLYITTTCRDIPYLQIWCYFPKLRIRSRQNSYLIWLCTLAKQFQHMLSHTYLIARHEIAQRCFFIIVGSYTI